MGPKRLCKSWYLTAATVAAISFIGIQSESQRVVRPHPGPHHGAGGRQANSQLVGVYTTFENAAKIMESALPIYDGHRHRAIELAKLSAKEIREAATGTTNSVNGGMGQRQTASVRAAQIPKGRNMALSKYSSSQIAASNAQMQQGMQLLQQGMQQLQSLGKDSGGHMNDAAEFGNMAMQAANTGLQFVAGKTGARR